jgi:hypothetical protein
MDPKSGPKDDYCGLNPRTVRQMKEAVASYRTLRRQLKQLEQLSRRIIFQSTPHPGRRKRLSQKVLGVN